MRATDTNPNALFQPSNIFNVAEPLVFIPSKPPVINVKISDIIAKGTAKPFKSAPISFNAGAMEPSMAENASNAGNKDCTNVSFILCQVASNFSFALNLSAAIANDFASAKSASDNLS